MNLRHLAALVGLSVLPAAGRAQLPDAKDLIQKWVGAVNANAWKGHKSSRMTAMIDLPAMGMSAKSEAAVMYSPAMSVQKTDIPGLGEMRVGFDGSVAWSTNPMQGAQLMPDSLLTVQKEEADPENYSRLTPAIVSSQTVSQEKLNGQDCYKVKHTWKSGRVSHDCFAIADGLIVWSQTRAQSPMGEIEVTTEFSGYKDFGGVRRAATATTQQAGQQIIITVQSWEWDTVEAKEFVLPPEVKALVDAKKKP